MALTDDTSDRLAILIDADNANPAIVQGLLAEVTKFGIATVKRIYGDWTTPNLGSWKAVLLDHSIQPIQQFALHQGQERHRQRHDHRCHGPAVRRPAGRFLHRVQRQRLHAPGLAPA